MTDWITVEWDEKQCQCVQDGAAFTPGATVRVRRRDGTVEDLIVGHINARLGVCDCCHFLGFQDRVIAYKPAPVAASVAEGAD